MSQYNLGHVQGPIGPEGPEGKQGLTGSQGIPGVAATIQIGNIYLIGTSETPRIENTGTTGAAVLDFYLPAGQKGATGATGATGPGATIKIGSVKLVDPDKTPEVKNSGTATDAVLDFTLPRGATGNGIQSITKTDGTGAAGTTDTYTILMTDGTKALFGVYQGKDGNGDMNASVYDPQGKATDIFQYVDDAIANLKKTLANAYIVKSEGGD